jgi:hypothetical protein
VSLAEWLEVLFWGTAAGLVVGLIGIAAIKVLTDDWEDWEK